MFLKSIFDRTASFFGLIFLFPILIIVGILIPHQDAWWSL